MKRIFKCHLIAVNFNVNLEKKYLECAQSFGIRLVSINNTHSLEDQMREINFVMGMIVWVDGLKAPELESIRKISEGKKFPVYFLRGASDEMIEFYRPFYWPDAETKNSDTALKIINHLIEADVPKRLDELVQFSSSQVVNSIFRDMPFQLKLSKKITGNPAFDQLVFCDTLVGDFFGVCIVYINTKEFLNKGGKFGIQYSMDVLDRAAEFINQFLGIVNHNIGKIPKYQSDGKKMQIQIGLPIAFEISQFAAMGAKFYLPSVYLQDDLGKMAIQFGFINLKNGPNIDLSHLVIDAPDDKLELF